MNPPLALMRRPAINLADGLTTMIERVRLDRDLAVEQWHQYRTVFEASGWETAVVRGGSDLADGVFIEDAAWVYGDTAFIARPGAQSRRPEVPAVQAALEDRGLRPVRIEAPGALDGGDVLKVGTAIYIGVGHRTNVAAIEQVRPHVEALGATVEVVPNERSLHLKSAITALPDGTIIGWPPLVDDPTRFTSWLAMPEESGAHIVDLGDGRLLMAASAPRSAQVLAERGWDPVVIDISEFEKLEGCVTCLSIRLRCRA